MTQPLSIKREPLEQESDAFRLALQAWPEAERAAQEGAMAAIEPARRWDVVLLSARRQEQLIASVLGQKLTGRAANIWPPQHAAMAEGSAAATELLLALEKSLRQAGVQLCQALLSPKDVSGPARLQAAGYFHAANLLYLTCEKQRFPPEPPELVDFQLHTFEPGQEDLFVRVIEETYEGTRDSPVLNGMRSTRDVVEGYKEVGKFDQDHWFLLRGPLSCEYAGCLILAEHPQQTMELIYVGITPKFRRRRLGELLTRHAQHLARQAGAERLVLAVDASNEPAIGMYSAAGFWAWDERACWVKNLQAANEKPGAAAAGI